MVFRAVAATVLIVVSLDHAPLAGQNRDGATAPQNGARATRKSGSIAGRVIHADGAAAEGARVAVYAMREGAPAAIVATATSAYDGRYQVNSLPAGQFAVGVTPQRIRGFGGDSRRLTSPPVETLYPGTTDRLKAEPSKSSTAPQRKESTCGSSQTRGATRSAAELSGQRVRRSNGW